jgi:hypothetical protein
MMVAERNHQRSQGVEDTGHMESREDGYMWRLRVGMLQRWLQTIIVVSYTPKTVYSRCSG